MWSSPQEQEPIEKIRKAQWTAENTDRTQAVVNDLLLAYDWARFAGRADSTLCICLRDALRRLKQLDPGVDISKLR